MYIVALHLQHEVAACAYLLCTLSQMVPYKIVKGDNGDAWVEASAVA